MFCICSNKYNKNECTVFLVGNRSGPRKRRGKPNEASQSATKNAQSLQNEKVDEFEEVKPEIFENTISENEPETFALENSNSNDSIDDTVSCGRFNEF